MKKATIKDVAREAGVTDITVSRTYSSPEKVRRDTREKIMEAAKKLNYIPNNLARAVRGSRGKIIGFISDDIFNAVYAYVIREVCLRAEQRGYIIMLFCTNGSKELEKNAVNTLLSYNAAGLIISPCDDGINADNSHLDIINNTDMKVMQFDRSFSDYFPGIYIDNIHAGKLAASVLDSSVKEILILAGPVDSKITIDRVTGIIKGLKKDINYRVVYTDFTFEKALTILKSIKNIHDCNFDAVITLNSPIALAYLDCSNLSQIGAAKIICIDELPMARIFGLDYSYVTHDCKEIARELIDGIIDYIENNARPKTKMRKSQIISKKR